jgi:hypothetical protein
MGWLRAAVGISLLAAPGVPLRLVGRTGVDAFGVPLDVTDDTSATAAARLSNGWCSNATSARPSRRSR